MSEAYVLLIHDRAGAVDFYKPFHIEALRRYCNRPPRNKAYKLADIYPSERAAFAAMKAKIMAEAAGWRRGWLGAFRL